MPVIALLSVALTSCGEATLAEVYAVVNSYSQEELEAKYSSTVINITISIDTNYQAMLTAWALEESGDVLNESVEAAGVSMFTPDVVDVFVDSFVDDDYLETKYYIKDNAVTMKAEYSGDLDGVVTPGIAYETLTGSLEMGASSFSDGRSDKVYLYIDMKIDGKKAKMTVDYIFSYTEK